MTIHETWLYCRTAEEAAELREALRILGFRVQSPSDDTATGVIIECDRFNQTAYAEASK